MARIAAILDTNIFLNVKNREEPFFEHSLKVLTAAEDGGIDAFVSAITVAELCTGYYGQGDDSGAKDLVLNFMTDSRYKVVDVNIEIADMAGDIRCKTRLPLPDSLIVASGVASKAQYLVSHDGSFEKAKHIIRPVSSRTLCSLLD